MRHVHRIATLALLFALILACAPRAQFMRASGVAYPPKPPDCVFAVLTLAPQRQFVELGTFSDLAARNPAGVFYRVREQACEAGADAVVAAVNGSGIYVQATAIRYLEPPAGTPQ